MSAVEPLATHVAILLQGRLAASGRLENLRADHGECDSLEAIYHRIARQQHEAEEIFA
jgi:ABC-type multidrug transport system ATPase subunit